MDRLNDAQRSALCHHLGPALVLAGPGSGKTTVLTGRVKYLIEHYHIPPSSILVITYTKAAALSMQQRFIREMNGQVLPVTFGTFHAIYYHILKEHYHWKQDSLMSTEDKLRILTPLLKDRITKQEDAIILLHCISLHKNGLSPEKLPIPSGMEREDFIKIEKEYCQQTFRQGKMDFDDMLIRCQELFKKEPAVLLRWQKQFSYILVDEFQDCNKVQYEVLKLLAAPVNNLFVVGDDDQAIYGFRGASPGILQQFERDYPQTKMYLLEANYRSRQEIVSASNRMIAQNRERFSKNMYAAGKHNTLLSLKPVTINAFAAREAQYEYLTGQLETLQKEISFEEMAVIFRTNGEIEYLIPYLTRSNIPYVVKDKIKSRYAHFAVQDVLAYMELATGKKKRQLFLQVMNKPDRHIVRENLWEEEICLEKTASMSSTGGRREEAESIRLLDRQLKQVCELSPYLAINFVRKVMGYDRWLREKAGKNADLYEEWKELLDEIQKEAKAFASLQEWIVFVKQETKNMDTRDCEKRTGVQLMTLHASKGLEFAYVCIPNANEGRIPYGKLLSKEAEEEERRLFYVGMTRAKKALDILYLTGTKEHPRLPSRFLNPLLADYGCHDSSPSSTSSSNS
ncbi:MAG: ATP-dependent helicase [Lachnospiraceae bacterium]